MERLLISAFLWSSVQGAIEVKTIPKESATVGGTVTLLCQLMTPKANVIQVTWQKESGNFTGTLATNSRIYGQKLLGYYARRTKHSTEDAPNVSAISISNLSPQDEGCFKCIFNLFPSGASTGTICLEVIDLTISEPNLEVLEIPQADNSYLLQMVTCSATGHPAPNISWTLPKRLNIQTETYTIVNLNKTKTVISNFTLLLPRTWDKMVHVICVVRHPSLSSEQHLSRDIDGPGKEDLKEKSHLSLLLVAIFSAIIIIGLGFAWRNHQFKWKQDKANNNPKITWILGGDSNQRHF